MPHTGETAEQRGVRMLRKLPPPEALSNPYTRARARALVGDKVLAQYAPGHVVHPRDGR